VYRKVSRGVISLLYLVVQSSHASEHARCARSQYEHPQPWADSIANARCSRQTGADTRWSRTTIQIENSALLHVAFGFCQGLYLHSVLNVSFGR
jgi:hypothetical protein